MYTSLLNSVGHNQIHCSSEMFYYVMPTLCNICRATVLSLVIFSQSWAAWSPSCFTWASRAAIFSWESTFPCQTATKCHVGDHIVRPAIQLYSHLPLGHAAMILSSFLENWLALRLLLLIQTALLFQLAELQLLKLLGPRLHSICFLSKYICSFTSLKDKTMVYILYIYIILNDVSFITVSKTQ